MSEVVKTPEHGFVGDQVYLASVFERGSGLAVVGLVEAWFDELVNAGAWVDERWAEGLVGRVDEHEWCETIEVDWSTMRATYGAERRSTGRYVDRETCRTSSGEMVDSWSFGAPGDRFDPSSDEWQEAERGDPTGPWDDETFWMSDRDVPSATDHAAAHHGLVEALRTAWRLGEAAGSGVNVPELLRQALEVLAVELGGVEELLKHRPGSREAELVATLVGQPLR